MPITAKIDEFGKPAWIALVILGFMVWWPLGLAALAFAIGSGRMGCRDYGMSRWQHKMDAGQDGRPRAILVAAARQRGSGNRAFDEYRSETLRRLEDEQREFHDFLDRLRMAKDKSEFDQFMADRRNRSNPDAHPQS